MPRLTYEDGMADAIRGCLPQSEDEGSEYWTGYYGMPQPVPEPPYQEPDDSDICGSMGHPYHGDDSEGGRCYCGECRYPAGGPDKEVGRDA